MSDQSQPALDASSGSVDGPASHVSGLSIHAGRDVTVGEFVGRDKIVNNIGTLVQRALTAAEEAARDQELEVQRLAEGVTALARRLQTRAGETAEAGKPYRGLLEYRLSDAEVFYGRAAAIRELLDAVASGPLTILHSESGAGKTSLLQAGLAPRLIALGHLPIYLRPYNADPALVIKRAFLSDPSQAPLLATAPLRDFLRQVTGILGDKVCLYLLLDQFEEFFTHLDDPTRAEFVRELAECLDDPSLNVRWVLALRTESFGQVATFRPRIRNPFENDYRLGRLTRAEAQQVILEPARQRGLVYQDGLVDRLLDDLGRTEIAPPQIQLVCAVLYDELGEGETTLTHALYEREGGAAGILRGHLERVLSRDLRPEQRAAARRLLETLITSEQQRVIRTHAELVEELTRRGVTPQLLEVVLDQLLDSRLIRAEETETGLAYELAHDYLLGEIRLDPDVQARKAAQELLEQETRAYHRYGSLLSEDRLKVIEPYRSELHFTPEAEALFTQSQQAVRRARAARQRGRNLLFAAAVVVAVAMTLLSLFALGQSRQATSQASTAEAAAARSATAEAAAEAQANLAQARALAAVALNQIGVDPERALLIALEAYQTELIPEVENALHQALAGSQVRLGLRGHAGEVVSARYSPDGTRIVTASRDKTARVWETDTGKELGVLLGHSDEVLSARFAPDGDLIVTASKDGTARVWDAATSRELRVLLGHAGAVQDAAFSPNGQVVATVGLDNILRLWDAASGRALHQWTAHQDGATRVAFNPDGTRLATAGYDGYARVWEVASGNLLTETDGSCVAITVAFSHDGLRLVTASGLAGYYACVWDAETGTLQQWVEGHSFAVYDAAFSPLDDQIVTASADLTVRLWSLSDGAEQGVVRGHTSVVYTADFDPRGGRIATAGDETARLWETTPGVEWRWLGGQVVNSASYSPDGRRLVIGVLEDYALVWDPESDDPPMKLIGHLAHVGRARFSPDGSRIVTPGNDGTARVWDAATGKELLTLGDVNFTTPVHAVAFSPDGRQVVTAGRDNLVHFWDATTGEELREPLAGHRAWIGTAAFSPDGRFLLTASVDWSAIVWNAATGERVRALRGHREGVLSAAYSPDGKWIVTASIDQTARVWDAATGEVVRVLRGHNAEVNAAAFSPDGQHIATASRDDTARIWDAATGRELIVLRGARSDLLDVAYRPDGNSLVTASLDGIVRLYPLRVEDLVALARTRVTRKLTCEERVQFLRETLVCPTPTPNP